MQMLDSKGASNNPSDYPQEPEQAPQQDSASYPEQGQQASYQKPE
jgi:hypothetical protein